MFRIFGRRDVKGRERCRVKIGPGALLMAAGLLIGARSGSAVGGPGWAELAAAGGAALLHEGGHWLAAVLTGTRIRALTLDLFGARMELDGLLSYGQELAVAAGGPGVNLCTAALLMPVWLTRGAPTGGVLYAVILASLGLSAVNLLPVRTLDGGRMLACLVGMLTDDGKAAPSSLADRLLTVTTAVVLAAVWLLAVYALLRAGRFLSLFAFSFCLLYRVITGDKI